MKLFLFLSIVLTLLTTARVRDWHDEQSLWSSAAIQAPTRPRVWVNLGRARQLDGDLPGAVQAYHQAIGLSFNDRRLHGGNLYARLAAETDMATVMMQQKNYQGAWNQITSVLRDPEWPMFPYAVFHRGVLEAAMGQCDRAKADWQLASLADGTIQPPDLKIGGCRP